MAAVAVTTALRTLRPRWTLFDGLRGFAAQIIVWHHLASYGPVVDSAALVAPVVFDLLFDYGRMAVHLFLVIGGYVAAEGLLGSGTESWSSASRQLGRRFLRLSLPYWILLILVIGANAWADRWIDDPMIAAPPSWASLGAHLLFLMNVLGFESLSAGLWYLAIDWQLTLVGVVLMTAVRQCPPWITRRVSPVVLTQVLWLPLACAAWFYWNRSAEHEWWFGFFFGSYFLGMTAAWCNRGDLPRWYGVGVAGCGALALMVDWRPRLAVALMTAVLFVVGHDRGWLSTWLRGPVWKYLGRHSYSLFLIHFPICLVMNGLCAAATVGRPWLAFAVLLVTYTASLLAADGFTRLVEWLQRRVSVLRALG